MITSSHPSISPDFSPSPLPFGYTPFYLPALLVRVTGDSQGIPAHVGGSDNEMSQKEDWRRRSDRSLGDGGKDEGEATASGLLLR